MSRAFDLLWFTMCSMQSSLNNECENRSENGGLGSNIAIQPRKFRSGNLILIGMMGSGKTTMARSLAKQLGKIFVDSDEEITRRTGVTIPHIFDIEGEAGFRQRESMAIQEITERNNLVLATGGGAVLAAENREMLRQNGIVIYLKANAHDLWQRTRHDRSRPLLQTGDPHAKLKELIRQRDPLYQQVADIIVHSGKQSAHVLMHHLLVEIEKYVKTSGQSDSST